MVIPVAQLVRELLTVILVVQLIQRSSKTSLVAQMIQGSAKALTQGPTLGHQCAPSMDKDPDLQAGIADVLFKDECRPVVTMETWVTVEVVWVAAVWFLSELETGNATARSAATTTSRRMSAVFVAVPAEAGATVIAGLLEAELPRTPTRGTLSEGHFRQISPQKEISTMCCSVLTD
ncbi:hypothetical protein DL767_001266 [Monosporascus sp. MG133]|nr:hypothetical protein DL767_001266 [Monosporascus sp. MG133]